MSYKLHLYDSTEIFNKLKKNFSLARAIFLAKIFFKHPKLLTAFEISANLGNNTTENDKNEP